MNLSSFINNSSVMSIVCIQFFIIKVQVGVGDGSQVTAFSYQGMESRYFMNRTCMCTSRDLIMLYMSCIFQNTVICITL